MSQLQAGRPVIPGLLFFRAGRSRVWPVYTLDRYGSPVFCYGDEYYFYFDGRAHTSLTERWQALFSRYF